MCTALITHGQKVSCGGEHYSVLQFQVKSSLRTAGQEWERSHRWVLLTGWLSWLAQPAVCCLKHPGPPIQRWHCAQWAGPFHINHQLKMAPGKSDRATFLREMCQVNIKLTQNIASQHNEKFPNIKAVWTWVFSLLCPSRKYVWNMLLLWLKS